ncbi:MAG: hypothetical protein ACK5MG_06850 [Bacteroidales bacterium]
MSFFYKKRALALVFFFAAWLFNVDGQEKWTDLVSLYGFVRSDMYMDTRNNKAPALGAFYLYPYDEKFDANGDDINDRFSHNLYSVLSRFGLKIDAGQYGKAKLSGNIEVDFLGGDRSVLRIRHAYLKALWEKSSLIVGQYWHPAFVPEGLPRILSFSTGMPVNPFSRMPQVQYSKQFGKFNIKGAVLYEFQFKNTSPEIYSNNDSRPGAIPNLYTGVDFSSGGFLASLGIDFDQVLPRTSYTGTSGEIYKATEKVNSLSYLLFSAYHCDDWDFRAKFTYEENKSDAMMMSGYVVKERDEETGFETYTPTRRASVWFNASHGTKWVKSLMLLYDKNLGAKDNIGLGGGAYYGMTDTEKMEYLLTVSSSLQYNYKRLTLGLEPQYSVARYGDTDPISFEVEGQRSISNLRLLFSTILVF